MSPNTKYTEIVSRVIHVDFVEETPLEETARLAIAQLFRSIAKVFEEDNFEKDVFEKLSPMKFTIYSEQLGYNFSYGVRLEKEED